MSYVCLNISLSVKWLFTVRIIVGFVTSLSGNACLVLIRMCPLPGKFTIICTTVESERGNVMGDPRILPMGVLNK